MTEDSMENELHELDLIGQEEAPLALSLDDLLPDAGGNVVLFNDAGMTEMAIMTEKPVIGSGIADDGTMVEGGDVTGMAYYSFDSGPTLFYPLDVSISVISETG